MLNLPLPEIDDNTVYANCIAVKAQALRLRFEAVSESMQNAAAAYDAHGKAGTLIQIATIVNEVEFNVTVKELKALYTNQFSGKLGPERGTYDGLKLAARRCPFCSHRPPRTLDHYLPKESFAEFSILSLNLVPCCRDCNSEKHSRVLSADEQFIHPYYDDISGITWLECSLTFENDAPIYSFTVNEDAGMSNALYKKMCYQMSELGLSILYSLESVDEVGGMLPHIREVYDAEGQPGLRNYLSELAHSKSQYNSNSWQAALYRCLAANDQFCAMGWTV